MSAVAAWAARTRTAPTWRLPAARSRGSPTWTETEPDSSPTRWAAAPSPTGRPASTTIDAVTICTPHHLHAPQTIAALRAGKHVMVEKPMAMNEAECREMIHVADECDRRLMVAYTMRFSSRPRRASKSYSSRAATARPSRSAPGPRAFSTPPARIRHWAARRDQLGGGVLFSHGCHYIDLIQWYLDALRSRSPWPARGAAPTGSKARARHTPSWSFPTACWPPTTVAGACATPC